MFREYFSNLTATDLPLTAMAFFLVAFAAILVHTLLRRRRDDARISNLPLEDSETTDSREVTP